MDRRRFLRCLGSAGALGLAGDTPRGATVRDAPAPGTARSGGSRRTGSRRTRTAESDWNLAWRADLATGTLPSSGVVLAEGDDALVVAGEDVVARDAASGEQRWRAADVDAVGTVVQGEAAVALSTDGTLRSLRLRDGDRRWRTTLSAAAGGPLAFDRGRILAPIEGALVVVDPADGTTDWRAPHDGVVTGVAVADDVAYATTAAGAVTAVDRENGDRQWRRSLDRARGLRGPAVADGVVVAVDGHGSVHAVSTGGSIAWHRPPEEPFEPAGALAASGGRCFATRLGDRDHPVVPEVVGLSLADGSVDWSHPFPRSTPPSPPDPDDGVTHLPTLAGGAVWGVGTRGVAALAPDDGTLLRRWELPSAGQAAPLVAEETVHLVDAEAVYALDRTSNDCSAPAVDVDDVTYQHMVPNGRWLQARGRIESDGDCEHLGLVELRADGRLRGVAGGHVPASGVRSVRVVEPGAELPESVDTATLRVRGTGGTVVAEREVPIDDYRDQPANFRIVCHELSDDRVGAGDPVTAELDVRNRGFARGYEAILETEEAVLDTVRGEIGAFLDDEISKCEGETVSLSHRFEEPGTYDLRARIQPLADGGSGDSVAFETLRVGGAMPGSGQGLATVGIAVAVAAAVARVTRRLRRD